MLLRGCGYLWLMSTPAIQHANIGDTALPYVAAGNGEALVLMHGALGDWRTLAP